MISTAKVVIYGAAYCSFCVKAKNLLVKNQVPVNWIDVEVEENRLKLLELKKIHNYSTIPMIFVDGRFIGGFSDLVKKINDKEITYDELKWWIQ